jgi:hypothetical protein
MNLCQYRDLFGKLGQGIHSVRLFDIAVLDVLVTLFVAYLLHLWSGYNFLVVTVAFFALGIVVHRLFCVRTTVDKFLFE